MNEVQKALAIRERLVPDSSDVARSYTNIGNVLYKRGNLEGAMNEYQKALVIYERLAPDSLGVASLYNDIGIVFSKKSVRLYWKCTF